MQKSVGAGCSNEQQRGSTPDRSTTKAPTGSEPVQITSVTPGWYAPGYRDPQFHLFTDKGEVLHVRLSPRAFVELHNELAEQQDCIDANGHEPLDVEQYKFNTRYVAQRRNGGAR